MYRHYKKFIFGILELHVRYGVNFGLTLSLWDYIFKTNFISYDCRDIEFGFEGGETFPKDFMSQELYPLKK